MLTEEERKIVTCDCGKRLRYPARLEGKRRRCKACGDWLVLSTQEADEAQPPRRTARRIRRRRALPQRGGFLAGLGRAFVQRLVVTGAILAVVTVVVGLQHLASPEPKTPPPGTWRMPAYGLSLEHPAGWVEEIEEGQHFLLHKPSDNEAQLAIFDEFLPDLVLQDLLIDAWQPLHKAGFYLESSCVDQIDGVEVLHFEYRGKGHITSNFANVEYRYHELVYLRGDRLVTLNASAPKAKWAQWKPKIDKILRSVRLR